MGGFFLRNNSKTKFWNTYFKSDKYIGESQLKSLLALTLIALLKMIGGIYKSGGIIMVSHITFIIIAQMGIVSIVCSIEMPAS